MKNRNYCFTTFNLKNYMGFKLPESLKYVIFGIEICPNTKKPHLQGYLELFKPTRVNTVKKIMGDKTMHLEKRRGSQDQAIKYCKKDEKYYEFGTKAKQGRSQKLSEIYTNLKDMKLYDVMDNYPSEFIMYNRGIKECKKLILEKTTKKFRKLEVMVYWGDTGTGKTRKAIEENENYFKLDKANNIWWDGYEGQETLIIDDFYGWIPVGTMLNILDGYQLRLPVKGSFTYAKWTKVIITSNTHPSEWYQNIPLKAHKALMRRISNILEFKN